MKLVPALGFFSVEYLDVVLFHYVFLIVKMLYIAVRHVKTSLVDVIFYDCFFFLAFSFSMNRDSIKIKYAFEKVLRKKNCLNIQATIIMIDLLEISSG